MHTIDFTICNILRTVTKLKRNTNRELKLLHKYHNTYSMETVRKIKHAATKSKMILTNNCIPPRFWFGIISGKELTFNLSPILIN